MARAPLWGVELGGAQAEPWATIITQRLGKATRRRLGAGDAAVAGGNGELGVTLSTLQRHLKRHGSGAGRANAGNRLVAVELSGQEPKEASFVPVYAVQNFSLVQHDGLELAVERNISP